METVKIKRNIRQTEFYSLIGLPIANNIAGIPSVIRPDNRRWRVCWKQRGRCEEALIIPLQNVDNYYQFNNSAVLCRTPGRRTVYCIEWIRWLCWCSSSACFELIVHTISALSLCGDTREFLSTMQRGRIFQLNLYLGCYESWKGSVTERNSIDINVIEVNRIN